MAVTEESIPDVVSVQDAAHILCVNRSAIYQAIQAGRLTPIRLLGKTALRRSEVTAYQPRAYEGKRSHTFECRLD